MYIGTEGTEREHRFNSSAINGSALTLLLRKIRNVQLNPGAAVGSLVALYLILYSAEVSTLILAAPFVPLVSC